MTRLNLAVFISGSGTNLQALIDKRNSGELLADIVVVISDRPDAYGLKRAERNNIPTFVVDYRKLLREFPERHQAYYHAEEKIIGILSNFKVDYVCLAGFMRLLSPGFLQVFKDGLVHRVINIHPALLPSFPGQHGYEDTFYYGCKWGGITVHFVDEGEDTGPIIGQVVYPIWPDDSLETIKKRGLSLEHELYPQCINWIARGFVQVQKLGNRILTNITDPHYSTIMEEMIKKALSSKHERCDGGGSG